VNEATVDHKLLIDLAKEIKLFKHRFLNNFQSNWFTGGFFNCLENFAELSTANRPYVSEIVHLPITLLHLLLLLLRFNWEELPCHIWVEFSLLEDFID